MDASPTVWTVVSLVENTPKERMIEAVAKVFLGYCQLVHIKGDLHQVSMFRHAAKKLIFFFCGSLNRNKIQERWCLHACFDSFTHFRLVFHIVNYDIHYVVYSERVREVLYPLSQCWLQAVF